MRHDLRLLTPLTLGALSLVLASCDNQPTQPNLPADRPMLAAASAPAPDTWIPRAPERVERVGFVTADVPNAAGQSVLYVIGGWIRGKGEGLKLVEAYNVATNTWSRKRDLPIGLANINGAGVIGGRIYIAGGERQAYGWSTYAAFVYDPATDTWTRRAGMPVKGAEGVVGVIGDKLYVAQPSETQADQSHFFRYDPATNKWATLPRPKHAYSMGGVLYGKLYLVGNQTEMYDPATNHWTDKAPPPSPGPFGFWGTAAAAQARLYVFLGYQSPTLIYAPLTDSWTARSTGPIDVDRKAARVFVDGRPRIQVAGEASNYQYVP
jgi:N-acetylneuraminic acid mutarotase